MMFIIGLVGVIFVMAGIFVAHFISNRWLWLAVICLFLGGFFIGICMEGATSKFFAGIIMGILANVFIIPLGILTKYYRKRGLEKLKNTKWK